MSRFLIHFMASACVGLAFSAGAVERFVWTNAPASAYPFTSWNTAATTVEAAVTSAVNGDVVWVTNGTYLLTNTIVVAKSITLRSVNGRDYTTLRMDLSWGSNRCLSLTANGTIDGFTIANGYNTNINAFIGGGGVRMTAGTIQNCTVVSNRTTDWCGGGINCSGGRVFNCLVTGNSAYDMGGGVYLSGSSAVMGSNCVISGNILPGPSGFGGGGVYMDTSSRITDCVVSNNTNGSTFGSTGLAMGPGCYASNCVIADQRGNAGAFAMSSGSTAEYCVVRNNTFITGQSAACVLDGTLKNSFIHDNNKIAYEYRSVGLQINPGGLAENCVISNNWGVQYGTGVRFRGGGTMRNCLVIANTNVDNNWRGSIYIDSTGATMENCTIALNRNGLYFSTSGTNVAINSIVYGQTGFNISENGGSVNWFTNCNVGATVSGVNNINANPAWVDPSNYNFRLLLGSACINAGLNQNWMTNAGDLSGRSRIREERVDMGCYEFIPQGTMISIY